MPFFYRIVSAEDIKRMLKIQNEGDLQMPLKKNKRLKK